VEGNFDDSYPNLFEDISGRSKQILCWKFISLQDHLLFFIGQCNPFLYDFLPED